MKLKYIFITLLALVTPFMLLQAKVSAQSTTELQCGANAAATGECNSGSAPANPEKKVNDIIAKILNIFSVAVGIAAVIMIILGGFRYITSSGDSGKVGTAKSTILYAVIGLAVVAIAQVIVRFVLSEVTK